MLPRGRPVNNDFGLSFVQPSAADFKRTQRRCPGRRAYGLHVIRHGRDFASGGLAALWLVHEGFEIVD
jgi:hypothetical protein